MTTDPSISVVIPTYNCARWLGEAVESALAQSLPPKRIIIVDDGSTDDTAERVAAYRDHPIVQYVRQPNQGVSAARNTGLSRAAGDFIAFLDADDVWQPRKLELQYAALSRHPELALLGTAVFDWPAETMPKLPDVGDLPIQPVRWEALVVKNYFATSSMLVRRQAIESVGPAAFDTALQGPEDYDLWLRIAEQWDVANLNVPLTGYRSVVGSLGKQAVTMEAGMGRILEKLAERGAWIGPGRRMLRRKAYGYFYCSCAYMRAMADNRMMALCRVVRSIVSYPLPFGRGEVRDRFIRPKLLGTAMLSLLGLARGGKLGR